MIILFIIFFRFFFEIQATVGMFLMYTYICEIFVCIYLYLKIFTKFKKKKKRHTLDTMELYLIITKSHLTINDPNVS